MTILLASKSPRRAEILSYFTNDFRIVNNSGKEVFGEKFDIITNVMSVSKRKSDLQTAIGDDIILTADTIVVVDNKILGKPKDKKEAIKFLSLLSGRTHEVITAYTVKSKDRLICNYVTTNVVFKELSEETINSYIKSNEWKDKAGAYGIQKYGSLLVKEIKGDYLNVVGLPISSIYDDLKKYFNFDLLRS